MITFFRLILSFALVLLALPANALSTKDLINRALQGEQPALGIIDGAEAAKISSKTQSSEPIRAKASRIQKFKQEGCYRIRVEIRQANAMTTTGKLAPFTGGFELNICQGGDAPFPL